LAFTPYELVRAHLNSDKSALAEGLDAKDAGGRALNPAIAGEFSY
jgi:hypothetical protein